MHEDYAKALDTEIETVKTDLAEKVDDYLTYAVELDEEEFSPS